MNKHKFTLYCIPCDNDTSVNVKGENQNCLFPLKNTHLWLAIMKGHMFRIKR